MDFSRKTEVYGETTLFLERSRGRQSKGTRDKASRHTWGIEMKKNIETFIGYLEQEKHASKNTILSYQRDLLKLAEYLEEAGITEIGKVTKAALNSYLHLLEQKGKAAATVSRSLASMKAYFGWMYRENMIRRDPAESIHAPKIEKKAPMILTVDEVTRLLEQPSGTTPKEIRDKAMLELLYATGIRVSELISLKLSDVNMASGFITCRDEHKERRVPFGYTAKEALARYLDSAREAFLKGARSEILFTNCSGNAMSRQGFWKLIKYYGKRAGIDADITPHTLRHSFAAHLLINGADMHAVQAMMGHSELASTQMYTAFVTESAVKEAYQEAHPRR